MRRKPILYDAAKTTIRSMKNGWVTFFWQTITTNHLMSGLNGVFEILSWGDFIKEWEPVNSPTAWGHLLSDLEETDA